MENMAEQIGSKYFPEWEKMTVREVREYLKRRQSVIVPTGVIEQHGYHLPLCTDSIVAQRICTRAGRKIGMIVAPTLHMSFSGGQLPGTINLNPNTVGAMLADVLRSLTVQGFRNLFLVLGHGGSENFRAIDNAMKLLLRDDPSFKNVMLVFAPAWRFGSGYMDGFRDHDWHAGWLETSLVMALAPELVQMDKLALDAPESLAVMREHPDSYQYAQKPVDDDLVVPRMAQRPELEVMVMGDPSKASPELGKKLVAESVDQMAETFLRLESTRSDEYHTVEWVPEPIIF